MPRKKEPSSVTEKGIFPTRLRELMWENETTQKKLGDFVGVRPQTISLYTTGQSYPDINGLRKIAEYFEVSADWLIGLTDARTTDPIEQAAFNALGLSERAIRYLLAINQIPKGGPYKPHGIERVELLSFLLSKPLFDMMLCECCIYVDKMREEHDREFFNTQEYEMCSGILKEHGFEISTKEQQAAYRFNEHIVLYLRDLLNQCINPKTERELLEEMRNAEHSREDDEDWE